jgi:hypothetical protein
MAVNMLFFMRSPGGREDELLRAVAPFASEGSLEVFADIPSFAGRIRKPKAVRSIALIWNPTKEDLRAIFSLRDFLKGVRILIALSDQGEEAIALAHRILPAYVTDVEGGISEIVSVLKKLAHTGNYGKARGAYQE